MSTNNKKTDNLFFKYKNFWDISLNKERQNAFEFCDKYKNFINYGKTEKQIIKFAVQAAKNIGFQEINLDSQYSVGHDKLIFINKNKSVIFLTLGNKKIEQGIKFLLAHVDSPRLDLKVKPLYEDTGIAYLKPYYYGGIKKYHWPTIPLSLIGTVILENGQEVEINIGEKADDPVFLISDLLPHIDAERLEKPLKKAIEAEELNIIVGSLPLKNKKIKERVKANILFWLNDNYKIREEDFLMADLRFVPNFPSRDIGFDRSMVGAYGQDDRVCVYTSLHAFLSASNSNTKILYLVDKEEIGSVGTTSARSWFLENVLDYLIKQFKSPITIADCYRRSRAVSADVTSAFDPDYKQSYDINNSTYLGQGVVVEKYLGWGGKMMSIDTDPNFLREIINLFNKKKIVWQTGHLGKVDQGGGGTIASYFANRNIETVDIGVPILNMHSPYELASKADIYSAYKAYKAFLEL